MDLIRLRAIPWAALLATVAVASSSYAAGVEVRADSASEGSFGLRVQMGPDCAASQDLDLDADDGPLNGVYQACRTVSAAGVGIDSGSVTFVAGDVISLAEGFVVSVGATFVGEIDESLSGGPTYVQDRSPIDESVYTARFSARLEDLSLSGGQSIGSLIAYDADWTPVFRVIVEPDGASGHRLSLAARQDGGGEISTLPGEEIPVPAGWNLVELSWASGAGDGELRVGLNGGPLAGLTALDNDALRVEAIRLGGVEGSIFDASGHIELDSYSSTR